MATLSPTNSNLDTNNRNVSCEQVYTSGFIDPIRVNCIVEEGISINSPNSNENIIKKCPKCPKIFKKARHLRWHMRKFHRVPLQCRDCLEIFYTEKSLSKHRKRWHQLIRCPFCPDVFNKVNIDWLDEHVTVIHCIKPHTKLDARNYKILPPDKNQCRCSMRFRTQIELDTHRVYECEYKGPPRFCCKEKSYLHCCCST